MASGTNSTFRQVGNRDRHRRPRSALPARDLHEADDAERAAPSHDLVAAVASGAFPSAIAPAARMAFVDSLARS